MRKEENKMEGNIIHGVVAVIASCLLAFVMILPVRKEMPLRIERQLCYIAAALMVIVFMLGMRL
jgi:energy-converting hydrogenase Eha subunit A